MTDRDESLLSAYLDGELDPESRRRVERALRADPRLARKLLDLSRVRDLVAGLSRPASRDVSGVVEAELARRPIRRQARQSMAASAVLAAAAALFIVILWYRPDLRPVGGESPDRVAVDGPVLISKNNSMIAAREESSDPDRIAERAPEPETPTVAEASAPPSSAEADTVGPREPEPLGEKAELPRLADVPVIGPPTPEEAKRSRFVVDLLKQPVERRIVLDLDAEGDGAMALSKVDEILRDTLRSDRRYGRLLVDQEIMSGLDRPGSSIVFAFVASEQELSNILDRVDATFGRQARHDEPPDEGPTITELMAQAESMDLQMSTEAAALQPDRGPMLSHRVRPDPADPAASIPRAGFGSAEPFEALPSDRHPGPRHPGGEALDPSSPSQSPAAVLVRVTVSEAAPGESQEP